MKTPEEIKKGLECCKDSGECCVYVVSCPYHGGEPERLCMEMMAADALAYIQQLESERDRYWSWIRGMGCETCSGNCDECKDGSAWEWSGAREVDRDGNA